MPTSWEHYLLNLFTASIPDRRVLAWADSLNILSEEQNGFRPESGCFDNAFVPSAAVCVGTIGSRRHLLIYYVHLILLIMGARLYHLGLSAKIIKLPCKKRETYCKFLEQSGFVESLTRLLYRLYDEPKKPTYCVHYFRKYFGKDIDYNAKNLEYIREEIVKAKIRLDEVMKENKRLRNEICTYDIHFELKPFNSRY